MIMSALLESMLHDRSIPTAAIYAQLFHRRLVGALRALQLMRDRAEAEGAQHRPTEIDEFIEALDHGGIHITCGEFRAMVSKQLAGEPSCKRR
jgi:CRP-like cAMP-binding protein